MELPVTCGFSFCFFFFFFCSTDRILGKEKELAQQFLAEHDGNTTVDQQKYKRAKRACAHQVWCGERKGDASFTQGECNLWESNRECQPGGRRVRVRVRVRVKTPSPAPQRTQVRTAHPYHTRRAPPLCPVPFCFLSR